MTQQRNALIDFFRVAAALAVGSYHFLLFESPKEMLFPSLNADQPFFEWFKTPVLFFFVLTAVVIPIHLRENRFQLSGYPVFMAKRLIRVHYPFMVLLVLTVLTHVFFLWQNDHPISIDWRQFTGNITLTAEFTHVPWYNSIFWTLAIEMQFYVLIGLVFPLIQRFEWKSVLGLLIAGEVLHYFINDSRFVWYYTPYLCLGLLFYLRLIGNISQQIFYGFLVVLLGLTACFHELLTVWVIVAFPLIMLTVKQISVIWSNLSRFTYSFYLVHGLVGGHFLYFTHSWGTDLPIAILRFILAFIVAGIASWGFYYLVEKPSVKWMRLVRYRKN
jgi:peptidoglycan/LPS O-acetylase OafA/YrhL